MSLVIRSCRSTVPAWRGALLSAAAAAATLGACSTHATQPMPSMEATQSASTPSTRIPDELVDAFDPPRPVSKPVAARAAPADVARWLGEGETAYRARRSDAALAAFERVVALDADHALAWLRIGNLHQQRRDWFKALGAYRRAASRSSGEGVDPALRAKALYNLAMINLELAQQTLRTLERMGPPAAVAGPREPLSAAVAAARRRLEAFAPPGERTALHDAAAAASGAAAPASKASAPAPRAPLRTPSREAPPRSEAQPELPRVDYIRGAPRP